MIPFNTRSRLTRSLSAAAALLTTALVLSSVDGLALHYEQRTSMRSAAVAPVGTGATSAA